MIKRLFSGLSALLISLSSLFVLAPAIATAAVDTCTWDGSAGSNWNTAANWTCDSDGEAVPGAGDSLVFDNTAINTDNNDVNNDIVNGSFANITFQGSGTSWFTLAGNSFTLTGTINSNISGGYVAIENDIVLSGDKTVNVPGGRMMYLSGDLSGSGALTKAGTGYLSLTGNNSSYAGAITINSGQLSAGANGITNSGGTTINDGAQLYLGDCDSDIVNGNFSLIGAGPAQAGDEVLPYKLVVGSFCKGGGGAAEEVYGTSALIGETVVTGNVTLGNDVTIQSVYQTTKFTGALSGNYRMIQDPGAQAKIVVASSSNDSGMPNGTYQADLLTKTLSDDMPQKTVQITGRTVVTINGKRGDVTVVRGGTIKGTGTVGGLYVNDAAVAPGLSPGCLSSGNLDLYGEYQFEAKGKVACSEHDQLKVTGTVKLTSTDTTPVSATINVSFIDKYNPAAGTSFVVIDNDGTDAVTGTFKDLAEGATFKGPNGAVLKISYKGGDGNDVVLTVITAGTPNTGFGLLLNNPAATLAAAVVAGGAILAMSRRLKPAARRVRR